MRKMIIRGDDVGYTDVCNIGSFRAIEEGIVTQADTMLECPGTVDALKRLRELPWVTIGWHSHFWGSPVLDPDRVSTLLTPDGRFKDNLSFQEDLSYDELIAEMDAEIERCGDIAGRIPEISSMIGVHKEDSVFAKAMTDTCEKYGIHYGFASRSNPPGRPASDVLIPAREKYAALDIYNPGPRNAYKGWQNGPAAAYTDYNPLENYIIADPDNMAAHRVGLQAWHPGYLDDFIWFDANKPGNTMTWVRVMDVEWMTSERCKKAIIENKIELINTHDALFGTNIYQEHLKAIGSPLWAGNFAD